MSLPHGLFPSSQSGELEGPLMGTPSKIQLSLELELLDPSVPVPLPAATINGHFAGGLVSLVPPDTRFTSPY